jgi:hypothetical protein
LSVAAAAAPATLSAEQEGSVRCLVLSAQISSSQDKTEAQAGLYSTLYWMGRVNGGLPGADLQSTIVRLLPAMTAEQMKSDGPRCGAEMKARGEEMQHIGAALQKMGEQTPK